MPDLQTRVRGYLAGEPTSVDHLISDLDTALRKANEKIRSLENDLQIAEAVIRDNEARANPLMDGYSDPTV